MEKAKEKILFVKPFEIESSYSFFNMVWTKIKKVFADTEDVSSFALLRSVDAEARYGFVSLSAWDSKEAFAKAVKGNVVLKYHISSDGGGKDADYVYLYKTLRYQNSSNGKQGNAYFIEFIKNGDNSPSSVIKHWERINELTGENGVLHSSYLCRSVSRCSDYAYVIIASLKVGNVKSNSELLQKIAVPNKSKLKNSYGSLYNKNFKTIIPNKY